MKTQRVSMLTAMALILGISTAASAATINWGSAQPVTADSDISTAGNQVEAIVATSGTAGQTVNGVRFSTPAASSPGGSPLNLNTSPYQEIKISYDGQDSGNGPIGLSSAYSDILGQRVYTLTSGFGGADFGTISMSNLTPGHKYQVQIWNQQTNAPNNTAYSGSPSVTLQPQTGNGQFAIGTFTATSSTESFTYSVASGGTFPTIDAIQVRDLNGVPLQSPSATVDQGFAGGIAQTINGNVYNNPGGWAVDGGQFSPQAAVYQTVTPLSTNSLEFKLYFTPVAAGQLLQDVQLSYTTSPSPTATNGATWNALTPTSASALVGTTAIVGNHVTVSGIFNSSALNLYTIRVENLLLTGITGFKLDAFLGTNDALGANDINGNFVLTQFQVSSVPEPSSGVLLALSGAFMWFANRKMRAGRRSA